MKAVRLTAAERRLCACMAEQFVYLSTGMSAWVGDWYNNSVPDDARYAAIRNRNRNFAPAINFLLDVVAKAAP